MTETMEWLSNFDEEIDKWIEGIVFGDIMAEAQQIGTQQEEATMVPLAGEATHGTEEQQPPHTEAEMDYALRAISLVQQALPMMNEAFRSRAEEQEKEIAKLKEAVAKLEAERDTRPAPPWVVIDNNNSTRSTTARVNKKPRAPRKKGTVSQEEARRAHRALNVRKWRAKRREEERQKEAEGARKRGLRRSNRAVIVLSD